MNTTTNTTINELTEKQFAWLANNGAQIGVSPTHGGFVFTFVANSRNQWKVFEECRGEGWLCCFSSDGFKKIGNYQYSGTASLRSALAIASDRRVGVLAHLGSKN